MPWRCLDLGEDADPTCFSALYPTGFRTENADMSNDSAHQYPRDLPLKTGCEEETTAYLCLRVRGWDLTRAAIQYGSHATQAQTQRIPTGGMDPMRLIAFGQPSPPQHLTACCARVVPRQADEPRYRV